MEENFVQIRSSERKVDQRNLSKGISNFFQQFFFSLMFGIFAFRLLTTKIWVNWSFFFGGGEVPEGMRYEPDPSVFHES